MFYMMPECNKVITDSYVEQSTAVDSLNVSIVNGETPLLFHAFLALLKHFS